METSYAITVQLALRSHLADGGALVGQRVKLFRKPRESIARDGSSILTRTVPHLSRQEERTAVLQNADNLDSVTPDATTRDAANTEQRSAKQQQDAGPAATTETL
ncbi:hypothetical protein BH09GEM1_BH09GEM1_45160 [soil metagenome]